MLAERPGLVIIADEGYVSRGLDTYLTDRGVRLLRPSYRNRTPHPLKPVRQRLPALTAAIRHNRATGQPTTRSLIAYAH